MFVGWGFGKISFVLFCFLCCAAVVLCTWANKKIDGVGVIKPNKGCMLASDLSPSC